MIRRPKLSLERETVRNLSVKSTLRAGSVLGGGVVGSFSNNSGVANQSGDPATKGTGTVGPHSSDPTVGGGLGYFSR